MAENIYFEMSEENEDLDQAEIVMTDAEFDQVRRELMAEALELERDFRIAKEMLFNERMFQIKAKIASCQAGTANEYKQISLLLEEAYNIRRQVGKHKREFDLEIANNKLAIGHESVRCDAKEKISEYTDSLRTSIKNKLSQLVVESSINKRRCKNASQKNRKNSGKKINDKEQEALSLQDFISNNELKNIEVSLPSMDLKERKCPVNMIPGMPYIVYNLKDEEIEQDIKVIMESIKESRIENALLSYNIKHNRKRKFLPNVTKALAKKTCDEDKNQEHGSNETQSKKRVSSKQTFKPASKFVQSYSIFESGVGIFEKKTCEIREYHTSSSTKKTVQDMTENFESDKALFDNMECFISDIKQIFPLPPILMKDIPFDPSDHDNSKEEYSSYDIRNIPSEFFMKDSEKGELFIMNLPEKLINDDSSSGYLGKVQILDNGQTRLVVDGTTFDLIGSRPAENNCELVRFIDTGDHIDLDCLGHPQQFIGVVPDLSEFAKLGR